MDPRVVRHVLAPLHERLLGRPTFSRLAELNRWQWQPADEVRAMQTRRLRRLLMRAAERPFYAQRFAASGVNPASEDPWTVLGQVPLLDRATIRENLAAMTTVDVPGGPVAMCTGGSTGEPLTLYVDRQRIACDKAARLLTHGWFGARCGDPEIYLWGSPVELSRQDRWKRWRDRLTNELLLDAFNLTPEQMERYRRRIEQVDPVSLFGYPSSLATFAEYCLDHGAATRLNRLRAVFVTGEWLEPDQRAALARLFNVPVANGYGSRDGGFIAHECPAGGMHLVDPHVIVEFIGAGGFPVADGETGEIVLTHLQAEATPLIRYRTGDLGRRATGKCACGRTWGRMGVMAGRQTDHLVDARGALQHGLAAIYVVREMNTVAAFQIRQAVDRSVTVRVVPTVSFGPADAARIERGLQRRLGASIAVRVHLVTAIGRERSGKYRQVISEAAGNLPGTFTKAASRDLRVVRAVSQEDAA